MRGSVARSKVNATSYAVTGRPSCQRTFRASQKVTAVGVSSQRLAR